MAHMADLYTLAQEHGIDVEASDALVLSLAALRDVEARLDAIRALATAQMVVRSDSLLALTSPRQLARLAEYEGRVS
jgi:hypothetical protein